MEEAMSHTPLVKWPGGKRAIAKTILRYIPKEHGTYYEPFASGAAVFFLLQPPQAVLSDSNADLINLYWQVRSNVSDFISRLSNLGNSEEDYYRIRSWKPSSQVDQAVRLYYLTLLSFNGIYRVNLKGEFNVPYGRKRHLAIVDEQKILRASSVLQNAQLLHADFEDVVADATKGDVVYFDPPYTVAHSNNGFVKYNEKIFTWSDQIRLASLANDLTSKGCTVIVSNADNSDIRELYADFHLATVERPSVIAASSEKRARVREHIFFKGEHYEFGTILSGRSAVRVSN